MEEKIRELGERNLSLGNYNESLSKDLSELKAEHSQLEHCIEELKQKAESQEQQNSQQDNTVLDNRIEKLKSAIDKEKVDHAVKLHNLELDIQEKEDKIDFLETEINELETLNRKKEKAIESLNKQLEETQTRLQNILSNQNVSNCNEPLKRFDGNSSFVMDKSKVSTPDVSMEVETSRKLSWATYNNYLVRSFKANPSKAKKLVNKDKSDVSLRVQTERSIQSRSRIIDTSSNQPLKCCVYICEEKAKTMRLLYINNDNVLISNYKTKEPIYAFSINKIAAINCSKSDSFLLGLTFFESTNDKVTTVILEAPNSRQIKRTIDSSYLFRSPTNFQAQLEIEKNEGFRNSALNYLPHIKKAGFLERYVNTISRLWQLSFCVKIEGALLIFDIPTKFDYASYAKYKRRPRVYYLENYNVITDQLSIGITQPNSFALKIKNENVDLIFSSLEAPELDKWVSAFN